MTVKTERMSSLFDQAIGTFGDALKSGVKIQEEVAKFWTDALDEGGPAYEWQRRSRVAVGEAIPAAQKNAEQWLKLVESNYQKSLELLKKAFSADGNGSPKDAQAKTRELWEASLELVRDNVQAVAQTNVKMMELWAEMLKKNADGAMAAAAGAPKSAAAK